MKRRKTFVVIWVLCISCIALLSFWPYKSSNHAGAYFSWVSGNPKDSVVQVTTGKTVSVPFEFRVGNDVSEVSFEMKDEPLQKKGVSLEHTVVPVKNGKASSSVTFKFEPGNGMKAGLYALTIIAKDSSSSKIIREADLQKNMLRQ